MVLGSRVLPLACSWCRWSQRGGDQTVGNLEVKLCGQGRRALVMEGAAVSRVTEVADRLEPEGVRNT
jgi:hypothetical protein